MIGLGLNLVQQAVRNASGQAWTPAQLFADGVQGVWCEPKPQYLYQDAAGTIPAADDGDPVGYMQDLSGNGNHATQPMSAARPKYPGLVYDGVDDALNCGGDRSIKPANITVSAWVNFSTAENGVRFLSDWHQSSYEDRWLFFIDGGIIRVVASSGGVLNGPTPVLGAWTHLAMTVSPSTLSLYINGTLFRAKPTTSANLTPGSDGMPVMLGKQLETGDGLKGEIAEFIIVDRALTPEEIQLVYNNKPYLVNA